MVTIQEAVQQVAQTKAQVAQRESEISQAKAEAAKIRAQPLTIQRQVQLQQAGGFETFQRTGGLAGEKERARKARKQSFAQAEKAQQELAPVKRQIKTLEGEIARARAVETERAKQLEAFKQAKKLFSKGSQGQVLVAEESKLVQKFFNELETERADALEAKLKANVVVEESVLADLKALAAKGDKTAQEAITKIGGTFRVPSRISNIEQLKLEERPEFASQLGFELKLPEERTFLEEVKARGPIEPTLSRLGSGITTLATFQKLGKEQATTTQKFFLPGLTQPEVLKPSQVGLFGETAPRFIPAVALASGFEKFAFKERREELLLQTESLQKTFLGKVKIAGTPTTPTLGLPSPSVDITAASAPILLAGTEVVGGGFGVFKQLTKPTVKLLPKPRQRITFAEEVQPLEKGLSRAKFRITAFEPARQAEVTTPLSRFLRKPSRLIDVSKPTTRVIETLKPITITQKGSIVGRAPIVAGRVGKRGQLVSRFVSELRGGQKPFTITGFEKLPKSQQLLFRKALEQRLGRPVPKEFVPKILGKTLTDKQFAVGELELQKLFRFSRTGKQLRLTTFKPGRTITRAEVGSIAEELKTVGVARKGIFVETKVPEELSEKVIFSRVFTKQRAPTAISTAARGKVQELSGITFIREPLVKDKGTEFIIGTGGRVSTQTQKVSQEAIKGLAQTKATAVKALPRTRVALPKGISDKVISGAITGRTITTTGVLTSALPKVSARPVSVGLPKTKPGITGRAIGITKPVVKPVLKPVSKPIIKTVSKPVLKPVVKPITKPLVKPILKPIVKPVTKPIVKPVVTPTSTITGKPGFPPPPILIKSKPRKVTAQKGFLVEVKRRGVFKQITQKALTREQALRRGAQTTLTTLARTFRIVPTKKRVVSKKKVRSPSLKSFRGFRIAGGRRVPLRDTFIQRARTALGTRGERREIQFEKKRKKGKVKKGTNKRIL